MAKIIEMLFLWIYLAFAGLVVGSDDMEHRAMSGDQWVGLKDDRKDVGVQSTTIVDLLSAEPKFAPLVHALQRHMLIPALNLEQNITLVAPSDLAFARGQLITRELLSYHVLYGASLLQNITTPSIRETHLEFTSYSTPPTSWSAGVWTVPPSDKDGNEWSIGGVPLQKLNWVADNGVIHVVDDFIDLPPTMSQLLDKYSTWPLLLSSSSLAVNLSTWTIFMPCPQAIEQFNTVESVYLASTQGKSDFYAIVNNHFIAGQPFYSQDIESNITVVTSSEDKLTVTKTEKGLTINDSIKSVSLDMISKNGVLHIIDDILFPSNFSWTVVKYLYGFGTTYFADKIIKLNLEDRVNDLNKTKTILAPVNESLNTEKMTKEELQYHIVTEKLDLDSSYDGQLFQTDCTLASLKGNPQLIKLQKNEDKALVVNGDSFFIGSKAHLNSTALYAIDSPYKLPQNFLTVGMTGEAELGRFFRYLHHADIIVDHLKGVTLLAPIDHVWKNMGLIESFLLLPETKPLLQGLMKGMIIDDLVYFDKLDDNVQTFQTLSGDSITLRKIKDSIFLNETKIETPFYDILSSNGVVHSLEKVSLPKLELSPKKVLAAADCSIFQSLVELSDMNLTSYIDDIDAEISVIAPTDSAFEKLNINHMNKSESVDKLLEVLFFSAKESNSSSWISSSNKFTSIFNQRFSIHLSLSSSDKDMIPKLRVGSVNIDVKNFAKLNEKQWVAVTDVVPDPRWVERKGWNWIQPRLTLVLSIVLLAIVLLEIIIGAIWLLRRRTREKRKRSNTYASERRSLLDDTSEDDSGDQFLENARSQLSR